MDFTQIITHVATSGLPTVLTVMVITAMTHVAKYLFDEFKTRRSNRLPMVFERVHKIYDYLNILLHETPAIRVSICKISNGGTLPRVGTDLYVNTLYELSDRTMTKSNLANRPVDQEFVRLLMKLSAEKHIAIETINLVSGGPARDSCEVNNIGLSELHELWSTDGSYLYLAINYGKKFDETSKHREIVRSYVDAIRNLIKQDFAESKSKL